MVLFDEWTGELRGGGMRDVHNRHDALVRRLRETRDAAEAAEREKETVLGEMAHELRMPMNSILLAAQSLEATVGLPASARQELDILRRGLAHQARLIENLIEAVKLKRGNVVLKRRRVDVHDLLRQTVEVYLRADWRAKGQEISFELGARDHHVLGDEVRLVQVFTNLVKNAIKFTPSGGHIRLATSNPLPHRISVAVADSGVGIPLGELPRIFAAFHHSTQGGGLGLGLTIARSIVEMHGGIIGAWSEGSGKGATFTVDLPCTEEREGCGGRSEIGPENEETFGEHLRHNPEAARRGRPTDHQMASRVRPLP